MPEGPELKIMADYINQNVKEKTFNKSFHVLKGNNPEQFQLISEFKVDAESFGKELIIRFYNGTEFHKIAVFMGMSGNWKWVPTENWSDTKFIRMRLDTTDGISRPTPSRCNIQGLLSSRKDILNASEFLSSP